MTQYQVQDPQGQMHVIEGPEGATPDQVTQQAQSLIPSPGNQSSDYWGDVKKNAIEGVKQIPQGVENVLRTANVTNPFDAGKSIFQHATGTPWADTETGQNVRAGVNMIKGFPGAIAQTATDVGKAAVMPAQMAFQDKPASQTMFGQAFRERPLSTVANVASVAIPAAKSIFGRGADAAATGVESAVAPESSSTGVAGVPEQTPSVTSPAETPNTLQVHGAKTLYDNLGIRGATIARMTPKGENPGTFGTELVNRLTSDGTVQSSKIESYQRALAKADEIGRTVQQNYDAIKQANANVSMGTPFYDKLGNDANSTLRPILDEANDLLDKNSTIKKEIGATLKDSYASLADQANKNGGVLTLDHIRDELHNLGDQYSASGANDHIIDPVYHRVVELRNKMVGDVADMANDQTLAQNLRTSNQGYATYSNILPDMKRAAAMEITGQPTLGGLVHSLKDAVMKSPTAGKAMMKAGEYFNGSKIKNVRKIR